MGNPPKLFGPNRVYERWRWQIFAITWLAYAGFYLTRKSFSVAKIAIGENTEIGLTQAQLAWIDGAFLTAYAIGQLVWGIAGDKAGARKVILIAMFVSVLTSLSMGMVSGAMLFGGLFLLQGFAQSGGWAPLSKNLSNFFSQRERGIVMGLWCTNYAVGGMVAGIYAGYFGQKFGWRYAFFIPALTLFVILVLFYFFQRNRPEDVGLPSVEKYHEEPSAVLEPGETSREEPDGSWKVIFEVLRNPMVILLTVVYFLLKPARYAILFWGPKYVHDRLSSGMAESALISSMFELAGPLSVFLGGWVSDRVYGSKRMPVSIICLLLLGVLLLFLNRFSESRLLLASSLFLMGLLLYAPDSLLSGTAAIDFGTKKGASTASGLINCGGSVGAIVGGTLPGFFQQHWGWEGVFTFLGAAVLIAAIILLPKWHALPPAEGRAS